MTTKASLPVMQRPVKRSGEVTQRLPLLAMTVAHLPPWVSTDETKPAPPPLLLVQAFVNTWEGDTGQDLLSDARTGDAWLLQAGLWDGPVAPSRAELFVLREVREAIRALLARHSGVTDLNGVDLAPLRDVARTSPAHLTIDLEGHFDLTPDAQNHLDGYLLRLLLIIRDAQRDGTWPRLKVCHNATCRWAFYDRSHTRQGRWCDMAVCGNRLKNRNLRARRLSQKLPPGG
jgi:predicted RNA-binding Zn ribbon-like protein